MAKDDLVRAQLISVYPLSISWKRKVMRMSSAQLFAILQKFKQEGRLK